MKNLFISLCLFVCIGSAITGCDNDKAPEDLIAEGTYINLLIEFQLAEAHQNLYNDKNASRKLVDSLLTVYGISYDQFLRSHRYYQSDLKAQEKRYQKAVDRLNETMDQVNPYKTKKEEQTPK